MNFWDFCRQLHEKGVFKATMNDIWFVWHMYTRDLSADSVAKMLAERHTKRLQLDDGRLTMLERLRVKEELLGRDLTIKRNRMAESISKLSDVRKENVWDYVRELENRLLGEA